MAYLTVTTQADVVDPSDGKLSLREAVAQANASASADTIRFIAALEGKTLVLTGGELVVTQDLTIDGDAQDAGTQITIDGNVRSRILLISGAGTDVTLKAMTLTNGAPGEHDGNGGGILLGGGSLKLVDSTLYLNRAGSYDAGGAIFAQNGSKIAIYNSNLYLNKGGYEGGGGIATEKNVSINVRKSTIIGNSSFSGAGGIRLRDESSLVLEDSTVKGNGGGYSVGGALWASNSTASLKNSSIINNGSGYCGGAIYAENSVVMIDNSTIAGNKASSELDQRSSLGGGLCVADNANVSVSNTTITNNKASSYDGLASGGGIYVNSNGKLAISDSIVTGNVSQTMIGSVSAPNIAGSVTISNGHNLFGSTVAGAVPGDRQNVAPATVFAALDPGTGGGKLSPKGIVPLKNSLTNPALSAADPITASSFGQLGTTKRPLPAGSLPDIGSIEINQPLSTSPTVNNDVLTGSSGANNLSGLAGNDLIQGLAGADTLNGNDGSDVLDGGPGNDVLNGGNGMDIATFAGSTAVVVDLSAKPATARRGGETDTLTSIEGIIGSDKADSFKGDAQNNEFQGGLGKDTATGGGGRDLYAFRSVQDSPAGAGRDVVKDFAPGQDVIDVGNIDADDTTPGQQSFRWVGKATLTGAAQLGYYVSGGNTIVRASTDADAQPELEIQLTGKKTLTAADFRF